MTEQPRTPTARPQRYHWYASRYLCAITLMVILALSVRRIARNRFLSTLPKGVASQGKEQPHASKSRLWAAILSARRAYLWCSMTSLPRWLYGPDTIADGLCTVTYCCLLFFFAINRSTWAGGTQNTANQMGVMAFSQLPLILVLIMKNNPISFLTGITYQKLNYLHRAAARACLLCSWTHVILWTPRVWARGHFSHAYIIWGLTALFGYTMLWTTSLQIVRRVAWEFFIVAHILFTVVFLVAAIFHWSKLGYWVWPSLGLWLCDRLGCRLRKTRHKRKTRQSILELIDHGTLRLTVACGSMTWAAGQHAFLSFPGVQSSPHESHPFSFANAPNEDKVALFILKVHAGVTKRLHDSLGCATTGLVLVQLEGPYGSAVDMSRASSVILIAGGTGITYSLSHLLALARMPQDQSSRLRSARLLWHVRQAHDATWILPILKQLPSVPSMSIEIDVFVTRADTVRGFENVPDISIFSPAARRSGLVMSFNYGRADIANEINSTVNCYPGECAVAVCGPPSLILDARQAVKCVWQKADARISFHTEAVGA